MACKDRSTEPVVLAWHDLRPQQLVLPKDLDFGGGVASDQFTDAGLGGVVEHGMTPALPGTTTPNQIIYVTSEGGIEVGGMFEPMWITGKLEAMSFSNELADVGYTMMLDGFEPHEY